MQETLVYGHNPQEKVVGLHPTEDNKMRIYVRKENSTENIDYNFYPFFFLHDLQYLENFKRRYYKRKLEGNNFFQYIVAFDKWSDMWDCIHNILEMYNKSSLKKALTYEDLPIIYLIPDRQTQFLIQSGITHFKNIGHDEIHRLQISIDKVITPGKKTSNPRRESDRITYIALTDNRGFEAILGKTEKSEKAILQKLINIINKLNPDIIEGFELHNDIIYYILTRCELHNINFAIGRDNSNVKLIEHPLQSRESLQKAKYSVAGRNLIDVVDLLQDYDPNRRIFYNYDIKTVAEHFKFKFQNNPETTSDAATLCIEKNYFVKYLCELFLPSFIEQARIFPLNPGKIIEFPSSHKIELLFVREYVHKKYSLPAPQSSRQISGGYTDLFYIGVFDNVYYIDIESMYPTLILMYNLNPSTDYINVFIDSLKELARLRIHYKNEFLKNKDKKYLFYIQEDFKILINTYFGYLAYHKGLFNDYDKANKITELGQEILKKIIYHIQSQNGTVIEVDTDGVYFVPPYKMESGEAVEKLIKEITNYLPEEINIILGGKYKRFLSYKKKNYAVLKYDDSVQIKGSALISKNLEKFGKVLIQNCINCILREEFYELHIFYKNLYDKIVNHKWNIQDFMRVETLKDPLYKYSNDIQRDQRNRNAAYELAIRSGLDWNVGDRVAYYVTGSDANVKAYENCKFAEEWDPNFPDENIAYYLKRLEEYTRKFEIYFSKEDFSKIFSTSEQKKESFKTIRLLTKKVGKEIISEIEEKDEPEYKIWLSEE